MLSAALTSFLTGITEPLEFSFLFVAPILYVIHAFFDGLAFMMADIFNITIGQTFSGGFIDFFTFGVLQGNSKNKLPICHTYWNCVVLFVLHRFQILNYEILISKHLVVKIKLQHNKLRLLKEHKLLLLVWEARDNIEIVDCCATRLRVTLHQNDKVDKVLLESTG